MASKVPSRRVWTDRIGIAASSLCALHCVGTTALLAVVPTLRLGFLADERLEWAALGLAIVVGALALVPSNRSARRDWRPLGLFAAGLAFVLGVRVLASEEGPWGMVGALVGAAFMVAAHVLNLRLGARCAAEACGQACE